MKKALLILLVVLVLFTLVSWTVNQKKLLEKTCFSPAKKPVTIKRLGLRESEITINMLMKNKSAVDYHINKQKYKVLINDKEVSQIVSRDEYRIKADGVASKISLDVKFNPSAATWQAIKELTTTGDLKIQLIGNARVRKGLLFYNYPVDSVFTMKDFTTESEPC